QLNNIVDFVEILNELNLDDTQVAITTLKGGTPFREDVPSKSDVIDTIIKHAPDSDGSYFVVPKIIE
ncbi:MAG: Asp-tRNA(Asn)/Glu-tRNA(Gln) amidotransferase subunit GatC, partial [Campylobacter sp.]|nr:Asp-tRNA(Asn)/Glu-tRNA(Gln) amidotransferase subunit GatC [Campylobacter sp.]